LTKQEVLALIDKYLTGETSSEEEDVLMMLIESFQTTDEWDEDELGSRVLLEAKLKDRLDSALRKRRAEKKKWLPFLYPWLKIAAFVVLLLSVGVYFLRGHRVKKNTTVISKVERVINDISPGGDIATLTLADGSVIPLNDSTEQQVFQTGGTYIQKTKNGQLVYTPEDDTEERTKELAFNVLSTPKGGQYQVILPDGSRVWLNAESSLRFPTTFIGDERKVELKGEAYFEVAKHKGTHFIVSTKGTEVEVLGTHFNVNAYEEGNIATTLVEGAVKVNSGPNNVVLRPGQVARSNGKQIEKTKADVEAVTAWKNGYFVFENENIQSIMLKLSRWYDAEVEYEGNMSGKNFNARISRRSNISEVLEMLELTGIIQFKIEGRKVTVMN